MDLSVWTGKELVSTDHGVVNPVERGALDRAGCVSLGGPLIGTLRLRSLHPSSLKLILGNGDGRKSI